MTKKKNKEKTFLPINTDFLKETDLKDVINIFPLSAVLHATSVQAQLTSIKKLTDALKNENCQSNSGVPVINQVLVQMYIRAQLRNPVKKVLSSCLQNLNEHYGSIIKQSLAKCIQETIWKCQNEVTADGNITNQTQEQCQLGKAIVENIFSFLDNFPLGEDSIMSIYPEVMCFLQKTLEYQQRSARNCSSPVTVAQMMQLSLLSIQVFNKILHKGTSKQICFKSETSDGDILKQMYITAVDILKNENAILDVRVNCAMCLPLILRVLFKESAVNQLYNSIVESEETSTIQSSSEFPPSIIRSRFPLISYVCLINGILAMLDIEELLKEFSPGKIFLIDIIGKELKCVIDGASLDLAKHPHHEALCELLQGQSTLLSQLIHYSWDHWEDSTDAVRHQARVTFENCIECHTKAANEDSKRSTFLSDLVESLLQTGLQSKGIYGPLCCLVSYQGVSLILNSRPNLVAELLHVMAEQAMASYVSEFYEKLFTAHKQEITIQGKVSDGNMELWQKYWVQPILNLLCNGTLSQQKNILEYIIPKLLKNFPDLVTYIGRSLAADQSAEGSKLCALVTCLRRAKSLGMLTNVSSDTGMWNGVVQLTVLKQALCHQSEQIRLDAIGLLCEHPKNTEPLTEVDLQLIENYLPYSLSSQTPSFRQHLVAFMKKLLLRMKDSGAAVLRNVEITEKKKQDPSPWKECLQMYKRFLTTLCNQLYQLLHPSAAFPSRTSSTAILSLVSSIFPFSTNNLEFCFESSVDQHVTQTLLESLADTFEQNKMEVFAVLKSLPVEKLYLSDAVRLEQLYEVCNQLSTSTRPQDCTTAAYLYRVLLREPKLYHIMMKGVSEDKRFEQVSNDLNGRSLILARVLISELQTEIDVSKSSLLHAAATKPMYPVLHCIRYLLSDLVFKSVENPDLWRGLLDDLILASFEVAKVVSPVVTNSSPEGNVCVEQNILGPGLAIDAVLHDSENGNTVTTQQQLHSESASKVNLMPEYLIVCCWRSIKEVSLLLGQLSQMLPVVESEGEKGLVTVQQLMSIGEYFITQLLESIHRGAFELAYTGFVKMTEMLWMSPVETLQAQPNKWLEEVLDDIINPHSKLCATRRSAGVPFYVQAIISMEPASCGRKSLPWIMGRLLQLSRPQKQDRSLPKDDVENTAQVHSLNILRALIRDTRLSDEVFPYIAEGLQAAIEGYSSNSWVVRNSASLLFSALMVRVFGVKRSKEESSKKNCMTGRVFFQKFPTLYTFLLQNMKSATENVGISGEFHLHPGLYPVLMVLGRLYPSTTEMSNASMNLAAFVPYVIRCGSSPVFKTRVMAARAIQPLVSKDSLTGVIMQLLGQVTQPNCTHNYQHGALLQISNLVDSMKITTHEEKAKIIGNTLPLLVQFCQQLQSSSRICFPVLAILCDVVFKIPATTTSLDNSSAEVEKLKKILQTMSIKKTGTVNIWYPEFQKVYAENYLKHLHFSSKPTYDIIEQYLVKCLCSNMYEVQLVALEYLLKVCDEDKYEKDKSHVTSTKKLMESPEMFKPLVSMVWIEGIYPECLALALECLCKHTLSAQLPWIDRSRQQITPQQVWSRLLILTHNSLDEIRCAALELIGTVLGQVITVTSQDAILTEVITLLEERCDTQQSVESRLAVASVLKQNVNLLLMDHSKCIGMSVFNLWTVIIRLLQDEDCDVRNEVAMVMLELRGKVLLEKGVIPNPTEPSLALVSCLEIMIKSFINKYPVELISSFLTWMEEDLEPEWETQDKEVRLFDKGEMNTYRDELTIVYLIQTVTKELFSFLYKTDTAQQRYIISKLEELEPDTLKQITDLLKSKYSSLCSEIEARLDWVNLIAVTDPFLKQEEYKVDVVFVIRKLSALNLVIHGISCASNKDDQNSASEMSLKIKNQCFSKFQYKSSTLNNVLKNVLRSM